MMRDRKEGEAEEISEMKYDVDAQCASIRHLYLLPLGRSLQSESSC